MIDQLPADPIGIEVADHGRGRRDARSIIVAERDAVDDAEIAAGLQCPHQLARGLLGFAAHDRGDVTLLAQDVAPVIGRKHAAIDDPHVRQGLDDRLRHLGDDRMARGRTGMTEQDGIR